MSRRTFHATSAGMTDGATVRWRSHFFATALFVHCLYSGQHFLKTNH